MNRLPYEIIAAICRPLADDATATAVQTLTAPTWGSGSDETVAQSYPGKVLLNLARTCRDLYPVVNEFVYEQISIMSPKSLVRLFFHFIDKPLDALAVRKLCIGVDLDKDVIIFEALQEFFVISKARGYYRSGCPDPLCPRRWFPVVKSSMDMALVTLTNQMLLSTTNLVSVSFVLPDDRSWRISLSNNLVGNPANRWRSPPDSPITPYGYHREEFLPRLSELQLLSRKKFWRYGHRFHSLGGVQASMSWSLLRAFITPSLRRLKIFFDDNLWHSTRVDDALRSSGSQPRYFGDSLGLFLEHVELLQSLARPKDLLSIFIALRCVKTLIIEMVESTNNIYIFQQEELSNWEPRKLEQALQMAASSLQHFHLTMPRNEVTKTLAGSKGIFARHFKEMKMLKTWSVVLAGDGEESENEESQDES